jgi:hypothetical protein
MAFDLKSIAKGPAVSPPRLVVYGPHGIGKTSLVSEAPEPIVLFTEDGRGALNVATWPTIARTWDDVKSAIESLLSGDHGFETFGLDSLDWLEPIVWAETARRNNWESVESPGYGKGYLAADDVWREFLDGLMALRDRGMQVILIAHEQVKRFDDPTSEPYDRYSLKLQPRAAALVQEWADAVLFMSQKTYTAKSDIGFNKTIARGVGAGERFLFTEERPAFVSKNRYGLPSEIAAPKGRAYTSLAAKMFPSA